MTVKKQMIKKILLDLSINFEFLYWDKERDNK